MNRLKKVFLEMLSSLCVSVAAVGMMGCDGVMVTPNGSGGFLVTPNVSSMGEGTECTSSIIQEESGSNEENNGINDGNEGNKENPDGGFVGENGVDHEHPLNYYGYCEECGFLSEKHIHCEGETEYNQKWLCEGGVAQMWCIYCSYTWENTHIGIGHSFTEVEWTVESTCYEEGYTVYACVNGCGETENRDFQPITHKIVNYEAKEPTCTEVGWYAYEACEKCKYTTYEERAKLGHSHTNYISNGDATCIEDGTKTALCDNGCGKTDTVTDENTAGHKIVEHKAKEPTCTEVGWCAYETCENCSYTTYQECAKLGHIYTNYISNGGVTCTENATQTATCDNGCGHANIITDEKATGHNWFYGTCTKCEKSISDGLTYALNEDKASYMVTGIGNCTDNEVIIPSTYYDLPVTAIGASAFFRCAPNVTSMEIPDSVTMIGASAFRETHLTSVVIGSGVATIGDCAFEECWSLEKITVSENNNAYKSMDGNLYNKDGSVLIQYAIGKTAKKFTIPDSVTTIGKYAFAHCWSLTSVIIGNNVTTIGWSAFYFCEGLMNVVLGNNVATIAGWAFFACTGLTSIEIPDSVTAIEGYAFDSCEKLTSVVIGNSVTMIGEYALSYAKEVYYRGTAEEWLDISIVDYAVNGTCYYYSENQPAMSGNYWYYNEDGEVAVW